MILAEKILLAAMDLETDRPGGWHTSELVLAAWRRDHKEFGLRGHEDQFPDSHKIVACLCGSNGVVGRGWLRRPGSNQVQLTVLGRKKAKELLESANGEQTMTVEPEPSSTVTGPPQINGPVAIFANGEFMAVGMVEPPAPLPPPVVVSPPMPAPVLPRRRGHSTMAPGPVVKRPSLPDLAEVAELVSHLECTTTYARYQDGRQKAITFSEACAFWGDTSPVAIAALGERLVQLAEALEDARGGVLLPGGRCLEARSVRFLARLHEFLADRFGRHLALMSNRVVLDGKDSRSEKRRTI